MSPHLTTEDLDGNGTNDTVGVDLNSDGIDDFRSRYARIVTEKKVWKLGDILGSTPRTASWIQLNTYDSRYNDATYTKYVKDKNDDGTPKATPVYTNRGMVFVGGNDGMLHAFKLGQLELEWTGQGINQKARITGANIGRETWAFIPKNSLPYLKYIMDPDYCHLYTVDLTPYIFDASIRKPAACAEVNEWDCVRNVESWRTILIGGMKTGVACRGTSVACSDVSGDGAKDCVNTPVSIGGVNVGLSSYFALDITDQNNPQLLWEFTHEELGFATSGPAVIRTGDRDRTGRWFVVLGSGPTGPIDSAGNQFLARSDQSLKLFVLDLRNGTLARKIDTGIPYAFAGSMINATNDSDLDYRDDTVYIGYTKRRGAGTNANPYTWTEGGIGRLMTREDSDPAKWVWSRVIDNIGSVTTSIASLQNKNKGIQWLYFGTGRWYYVVNGMSDDPSSQRRIFGIKEPCYSFTGLDPDCTTSYSSVGDFTSVSDVSNVPDQAIIDSVNFKGWYIELEAPGNYTYDGSSQTFHAERVITDPLATSSGIVFFSTYKPFNDECSVGGKTFLWSAKYDSGGPGGSLLRGKALIQVSTGSIEEINLSSAFTEKGDRRTSAI